MATPSYRSGNATTGGTEVNITLIAPSGLADHDVLIAAISIEDPLTAITPPAGWNLLFDVTQPATSPDYRLVVYWKRASSESGDYVFQHSSEYRAGFIAAYQNVTRTGNPIQTSATLLDDGGGDITCPSVTTNTNAQRVLCIASNFNAGAWTPPAGIDERIDNGENMLADYIQTAAGATGTKDFTHADQLHFISSQIALINYIGVNRRIVARIGGTT